MKLKKEDIILIELGGNVRFACSKCPLQKHTINLDETPIAKVDTELEETVTPYCVKDGETCVHFDNFNKINSEESLICYYNR